MLVVGNRSQQPLVFGGVSQIESRPNWSVSNTNRSFQFTVLAMSFLLLASIYFLTIVPPVLPQWVLFCRLACQNFVFMAVPEGSAIFFCTFSSLKSMQYSWTSHPRGWSWSVCEAERVRCNSNATPRALLASAGTSSEAGREAGENNAKSERCWTALAACSCSLAACLCFPSSYLCLSSGCTG